MVEDTRRLIAVIMVEVNASVCVRKVLDIFKVEASLYVSANVACAASSRLLKTSYQETSRYQHRLCKGLGNAMPLFSALSFLPQNN